MNLRQLFILSILIKFTTLLTAQTVTDKQILRLELHPTDSAKFIAKMYNNKTGKLEEYWEMITHVPEITIAGVSGDLSEIVFRTSKPSIFGMRRSINTISGPI